jgi:hypothetical protein
MKHEMQKPVFAGFPKKLSITPLIPITAPVRINNDFG